MGLREEIENHSQGASIMQSIEEEYAGLLLTVESKGKDTGLSQLSSVRKNLSENSSHDIRLDVENLLTVILENDPALQNDEDRYFIQGALNILDRIIIRDYEEGIAGVPGGACSCPQF